MQHKSEFARSKTRLARTIVSVTAGMAAVALLASCSSGAPAVSSSPSASTGTTGTTDSQWAAVVAKAKTEGGATALVTDPSDWQDVQSGLALTNTGLRLTIGQSGAGADLETRLLAEIASGNVQTDLINDTDLGFYTAHKDDFYDLSTFGMPNYATYPKTAIWQNTCVIYKQSVSGITYNTQLVPANKVPKTWKDLLDPFWKGKIVLSNPAPGGYYLQWALMMQDAFGDSYLKGIGAQNPALDNSSVSAAAKVAAGADLVSVLSQGDSASALIAKGAPLKFKILRNPDLGANVCFGIPKDAPHPAAAAVLLNMFMSAGSQSATCRAGLVNVSPAKGKGCFDLPSGFTYPKLDATTGEYAGIMDPARKAKVLADLGIN